MCTFKVAPEYAGRKYGELLLKTLFDYTAANRYDWMFVTVFPKHQDLIAMLSDFGFKTGGKASALGEEVLLKPLTYDQEAFVHYDPLDFNIRYGPAAIKLDGARAFVVPIQPKYHSQLFPELERQMDLMAGGLPQGNTIRKAYLCHSRITGMNPGDVLLFYRSHDWQHVAAVGVLEKSRMYQNPFELAAFVGHRTVYSLSEISRMCTDPVLTLLFRHALSLREPIPLAHLVQMGILRCAPQSIVSVPEVAVGQLAPRLCA